MNGVEVVRRIHEDTQRESQSPDFAYAARVNGETVISVNGDQQFRIASMTKSFIAAAVLMLRDRGLLTLDTPIATVVPEFASLQLPTDDSPPLLIRDFVTMSTGFASDDPWGDRQMAISEDDLSEIMRDGAYFSVPSGTQFMYSNYGYAVLGRVITNVSRIHFSDFVEHELLRPLALERTSWEPVDDTFARPHRLQDGQVIPDLLEPLRMGAFAPMAGLWSTAHDLLRWSEFFLDAYPARDDTDDAPLRRSSRREMQQIQRYDFSGRFAPRGVTGIRGSGYGMGLLVLDDPKLGHYAFHPGGLPGYGSSMGWLVQRRSAVVGLANITYAPMRMSSYNSLNALDDLGLLPQVPLLDVPLLQDRAERLVKLFNDWDDTVADELFAMNVPLDLDYGRRRQVVTRHGVLRLNSVVAQTYAVAVAHLSAQDGTDVTLTFNVSPERYPRVQAYWFQSG